MLCLSSLSAGLQNVQQSLAAYVANWMQRTRVAVVLHRHSSSITYYTAYTSFNHVTLTHRCDVYYFVY
jgi:hypothetical protein